MGIRSFLQKEKPTKKGFWHWFSAHEKGLFDLVEKNHQKVVQTIGEHLTNHQRGLVNEISIHLSKTKKRELIISADGNKELFPAVIELIKEAPPLTHWETRAFRRRYSNPEDLELEFNNIRLDPKRLLFTHKFENEKINLLIVGKNVDPQNSMTMGGIFILLDALLGEYDVETKIGQVHVLEQTPSSQKGARGKMKLLPLTKLATAVDSYFSHQQ